MSTPYNYVASSGIIVPDTSDIKTQIETEYQAAYGSDIALGSDTIQGKQIAAETTARSRVAQMLASVANLMNPNQAGGIALDAICAFLGLTRESSTFTTVPNVTVSGVPNSLFSAGQLQAKGASSGAYFVNTRAIQLSSSGSATVDFVCQTAGPIDCPAADLEIATQVLGWETINNASAGTPGIDQQSDVSLRAARNRRLGLQGQGTPEAIISALDNVPDVASVTFRENYTGATAVIDGITLLAHSVWACVDGGTDIDVATALLASKGAGANWNGATSVNVVDASSGQTYPVQFDRPSQIAVMVRATMRQGTSTADLSGSVPQAVIDYSTGKVESMPGFVTGASVSPFDISAGITEQLPGCKVAKLEVALLSGTPVWQTTEISIALNQKATITLSAVQVLITP